MNKKESSFLLDKAKFKSRRGLNELDQILVPFVTKKFLPANVNGLRSRCLGCSLLFIKVGAVDNLIKG